MPVWAWALPLIIVLLAAGGVGGWVFLSNQEKAASDTRATATVVAQQTSVAIAQATTASRANATATAQEIAAKATIAAGLLDSSPTPGDIDATPTLPAAVIVEPARMSIEEFITLYEDPANRPIIVDVRSTTAYEEGHIAGAVSIPDAETESRLSDLPKDKLIVAYCQ
jgi:hypothetical protein